MKIKGMALSCAIVFGELFSITAFASCDEAAANLVRSSNPTVCYAECVKSLNAACSASELQNKCSSLCIAQSNTPEVSVSAAASRPLPQFKGE